MESCGVVINKILGIRTSGAPMPLKKTLHSILADQHTGSVAPFSSCRRAPLLIAGEDDPDGVALPIYAA
jgi:hypothetical protein